MAGLLSLFDLLNATWPPTGGAWCGAAGKGSCLGFPCPCTTGWVSTALGCFTRYGKVSPLGTVGGGSSGSGNYSKTMYRGSNTPLTFSSSKHLADLVSAILIGSDGQSHFYPLYLSEYLMKYPLRVLGSNSSSIYATNSALCLSSKGSNQEAGGSDLISPQAHSIARGPWAGNTASWERISSLTSDARSREARQHCMLLFTRENRDRWRTKEFAVESLAGLVGR